VLGEDGLPLLMDMGGGKREPVLIRSVSYTRCNDLASLVQNRKFMVSVGRLPGKRPETDSRRDGFELSGEAVGLVSDVPLDISDIPADWLNPGSSSGAFLKAPVSELSSADLTPERVSVKDTSVPDRSVDIAPKPLESTIRTSAAQAISDRELPVSYGISEGRTYEIFKSALGVELPQHWLSSTIRVLPSGRIITKVGDNEVEGEVAGVMLTGSPDDQGHIPVTVFYYPVKEGTASSVLQSVVFGKKGTP